MTDLQLRIEVGGQTFTYTDADMGQGSVVAGRDVRDGKVEQDDVPVTIDAAQLGPWSSPLEMPGDRFRAELRDTIADEVVIDGTVHRTGVVPDDPAETDGLRRWEVRVFDTSLADLLEALDSVSLRALAPAVEAMPNDEDGYPPFKDVRTFVRRAGSVTPQITDVRWWSARRLLEAALTEAGATAVTVPKLFPLRHCYVDGNGDVQVETDGDRGYVAYVGPLEEGQSTNDPASTIPDVSGGDWLSSLNDLLGLSVRASYAAWPSPVGVATVELDRWVEPDPAALTALDDPGTDRLALAGWDIQCDPGDVEDFAVRFANDLDESTLGEVVSPVAARYASGRAVFESGINSSADAVDFRQPRYTEVAGPDPSAGGFGVKYGAPYLDGEVDEPYLVWLQGVGLDVALLYYEAETAAPDCPKLTNPVWASTLYAYHALRAGDVHRCQVEVDADRITEAGAPLPQLLQAQYAVEGAGWRTEEISEDADSTEIQLTLARPASGYAVEAALGLFGPPSLSASLRYWYVEDQAGNVEDDGYEAVAVVRPGTGLSTPDRYEVDHTTGDPVTGPWTAGRRRDLGGSPETVHFRARSVYEAAGFTSGYVYATAS